MINTLSRADELRNDLDNMHFGCRYYIGVLAELEQLGKTHTADFKRTLSFQNIGPDKINQMRHVLFFKNLDGVLKHMRKQADIIRPKFETVLKVLKEELSETGIANWNTPKGGYFVSAELMGGTAKRTVELCAEAGLV